MNRSILKRLQISYANNRDPKDELQKFSLMYNGTPHGTTGKTPSELMFGRQIRDKIPSIADVVNERLADEEMRDYDWQRKLKGKEREDRARAAKDQNIEIGNKVILKNLIKATKLTPTFAPEVFEVLQRNGNELLLFGNGKTLRRNVAHVKLLPNAQETLRQGAFEGIEENRRLSEDVTAQGSAAETQPVIDSEQVPQKDRQQEENNLLPDEPRVEPLRLKKKEGMWNLC